MSEQVLSGEESNTSINTFAFTLKVLTDVNSVAVGDCLLGIEDTRMGGGYVIHLKVADGSTYDLLKNPMDFYDILEALEGRWELGINEELVTISYVRKKRKNNYYPWSDESFFTRPVKDKDNKVVGLEVLASNNPYFTLRISPGNGWAINYVGKTEVIAQVIPVTDRNPALVGGELLILVSPDGETHFHYTLHTKTPVDHNFLAAVAGSILCSTFGTVEGHYIFNGTASVSEMDITGDDVVLKDNDIIRLEITAPGEDTHYTVLPKSLIQYRLQ